MRVLVCGGRNYNNMIRVFNELDFIHTQTPITAIVHGDASGADTLGGYWAQERGLIEERYPARWAEFGKSAGPRRNVEMAQTKPDLVVAFPGGRGTKHMIETAKLMNIPLRIVVE